VGKYTIKSWAFNFSIKEGSTMLVEFSFVPIGAGTSLGGQIAEVLKIVEESGLPYKLNPMGTVIEGGWDDTMDVIRKCHESLMGHDERVYVTIKIDDRKGRTGMMESKVRSVEEKLGHALEK
jgi:uncharacterized protein (TIGR00106 family)